MRIKDAIAIVTGGGSGIGEATARELAARGARTVALVDLAAGVREIANDINRAVGRDVAVAFTGDVASASFRRETFDRVIAEHGIPRICVPAAGITRDALAVKVNKSTGQGEVYSEELFRQVLDVNLTAPTYWALELVARIATDRARRGAKRWEPAEEFEGAVVLVGSVSSQGNRGQISYAASKAGLEGVAATLSQEAIYYGVRCAVIHPGFTDTPMVRALGSELIERQVLPHTQLRRLIKPEEIADAICFLVSNPAVSGSLWADAGWHPSA